MIFKNSKQKYSKALRDGANWMALGISMSFPECYDLVGNCARRASESLTVLFRVAEYWLRHDTVAHSRVRQHLDAVVGELSQRCQHCR